MKEKALTVIFCGGGTGGHVFPSLALAQRLREKHAGSKILFLGKKGKLEEYLAAKNDFAFHDIACCQFPEKGIADFFRFILRTLAGTISSLKIILREKPDFIIGSGGYVSIPGVAAGLLTGKKVYLLEQNVIPGKTNKIFALFARKIFTGLPVSGKMKLRDKWVYTGNPLRTNLKLVSRDSALRYFGMNRKPFCIGIIGGSQGAAGINGVMPEALNLMKNRDKSQVIHIAGRKCADAVIKKYRDFNIDAKVLEFIDDIENFYSAIDVIVSRAGALALAEISYYRLPALLIPFPHAAQDHQKLNAELVSGTGAACWLNEGEAIPPKIANALDRMLDDAGLRGKMRASWEKFYRTDSAGRIIEIIEEDMNGGKKTV
ncbi:MAG: undecaprenyldiphospho-muramoylpentapeptide beta-N-acetylglucosaminyltransferase [Candidatus Aureabacteria bacterium]|nr:undecaprenyldiphospho-muramoylpentapeptide beta-N-acetylglucosaminyltransferase [Candidatus Auribacterota bacterium]